MLKEFFLTFTFLFFTLTFFDQLYAQCDSIGWSNDPSVNLNVSPWGQNPRAVTDGDGGVYILWNTNSYTTFQYLQHVDKCGIIQWTAPVEIRGEWNGTRFYPDLAEDGFGGALVTFTEWEVSGPQPWPTRVRVNRADQSGNLQWGPLGVHANLKDTSQYLPQIVPDSNGGAFVTYWILDDSLYLQHISSAGERLWGDEGVLVTDTARLSLEHILISDGTGGVIIQWFGYDTGFKRYDSKGNLLWYTPSPNINLYYSNIIPDGTGGAVLGGVDRTSAPRKIIANRISPDGMPVWGQNGLIIEDSLNTSSDVTDIVLRSDSSIVIYWTEVNNPVNDFDIFTQIVKFDGSLVFPESIPISTFNSLKGGGRAILNNNNSVIFTWSDYRSGNKQFYCQKLDTNGYQLWSNIDVPVTIRDYNYYWAISDLDDGMIIVWGEILNGIFAQQVSKNGNLGEILTSIELPVENIIPQQFTLYQNFPNPFNSSSVIRFKLSKRSDVKLTIFNLLGEEIKTLVQGVNSPGVYEIIWNGEDDLGSSVASGIYFYRIIVNKEAITKKMLFLK